MENVTVQICKDFILDFFRRHGIGAGVEINCFFKAAENAGLYAPDTYGSPMSLALSKLVDVEPRYNASGEYVYSVFKLLRS